MIVADASELTSTSRLARLKLDVKECTVLESLTGADLMLTKLSVPVTEALLPRHIAAGAVLIQLKFGRDLLSSITDNRLKESIERMRAVAPYASQRRLMVVGILSADNKGKAVTDNQSTHLDYTTVMRAIDRWQHRGGTYSHVYHERFLAKVLSDMEEELSRFGASEEYWPSAPTFESDDVLELSTRVSDWRPVLAAIPGIGPAKATNLRNAMLEHKVDDSYGQALVWATADKAARKTLSIPKVPLWGDKTFDMVRHFVMGKDLDFGEGYSIRLKFEVEKNNEG